MEEPTARERALGDLQRMFNETCERGLDILEKEARTVLRGNDDLSEFVMGNGIAFFVDKDGENIGLADDERFKFLDEFLLAWDEWLHMTGYPMRFTAYGPKVDYW